jgi:hypothetical protein
VIDLDEEAYEPADDIEIYEPEPAQLQDDGEEEEDYSPPPAEIGPSEPLRGRQRNRHGGTNGYDTIRFLLPSLPSSFRTLSRRPVSHCAGPAMTCSLVASVAVLWARTSVALRSAIATLASLSSL